VVTAVSLAGAGARQVRLSRIRAAQPVLQRCAGIVLAIVGGYLILYWVTDLAYPFSSPAPPRAVEWAQNHLAAALAASPRLTGLVIGAVVVAVLGTASVYGARGQRQAPPPEPSVRTGDRS
jgi:hypothetical protein